FWLGLIVIMIYLWITPISLSPDKVINNHCINKCLVQPVGSEWNDVTVASHFQASDTCAPYPSIFAIKECYDPLFFNKSVCHNSYFGLGNMPPAAYCD